MEQQGKKSSFKLPAWMVLHPALFLLNLWIFLRIGLQTMVPTFGLVELYLLAGLLFSIFTREEIIQHKTLIGFSLVPLVINALLLVNYFFSANSVTETQVLRLPVVYPAKGICLVSLNDNAYEAYSGIRVFWMPEPLKSADSISYTFKTGLFGIRVMREYKFL